MKYLKIAIQTLLCVGAFYAVAFSSVLVHPLMILLFLTSFAILAIFVRLVFLKRVSWVVVSISFLLAAILFSPIVVLHPFLDQGFDDGPFYGKPLDPTFEISSPTYDLPYLFGHILILNRDTLSPVMAFRDAFGNQKWAIELSVDEFEGAHFYSINRPRIVYGTFRDQIQFLGHWTGGAESGYAYVWKFGGFQKFNLSW